MAPLRQRMVEDMQLRNSPEDVNQQVSALKFIYLTTLEMPRSDVDFPRVKRPHRLPVVLSHEEVVQFFDHGPRPRYRAALLICYGAGLRVSGAVAVKVSGIDSTPAILFPSWRPGRHLNAASRQQACRAWLRSGLRKRVAVQLPARAEPLAAPSSTLSPSRAYKHRLRIQLEMGGKNPTIVLAGAGFNSALSLASSAL